MQIGCFNAKLSEGKKRRVLVWIPQFTSLTQHLCWSLQYSKPCWCVQPRTQKDWQTVLPHSSLISPLSHLSTAQLQGLSCPVTYTASGNSCQGWFVTCCRGMGWNCRARTGNFQVPAASTVSWDKQHPSRHQVMPPVASPSVTQSFCNTTLLRTGSEQSPFQFYLLESRIFSFLRCYFRYPAESTVRFRTTSGVSPSAVGIPTAFYCSPSASPSTVSPVDSCICCV